MIDSDHRNNVRSAIQAARNIQRSAADARKKLSLVVVVPSEVHVTTSVTPAHSTINIVPTHVSPIDDRCCRICLEDEGEMISPCACRGTQALVHRECLDEWRLRFHHTDFRHHSCLECREQYKDVEIMNDDDDYQMPASFFLLSLSLFVTNLLFMLYFIMGMCDPESKFVIACVNSTSLICVRPLRRGKKPRCCDLTAFVAMLFFSTCAYGMVYTSIVLDVITLASIPIITTRMMLS